MGKCLTNSKYLLCECVNWVILQVLGGLHIFYLPLSFANVAIRYFITIMVKVNYLAYSFEELDSYFVNLSYYNSDETIAINDVVV